MSVSLSIYPSVCLSIHQFVYLSISLSVSLYIYLFVYLFSINLYAQGTDDIPADTNKVSKRPHTSLSFPPVTSRSHDLTNSVKRNVYTSEGERKRMKGTTKNDNIPQWKIYSNKPKNSVTPRSFTEKSTSIQYLYIYFIYIHSSIHSSIHPSIHLSIRLSIYLTTHLFIHPFICSFIHPHIHPFICPSIHQFIHLLLSGPATVSLMLPGRVHPPNPPSRTKPLHTRYYSNYHKRVFKN